MSSSPETASPRRLPPEPHPRVWGSTSLEPWFRDSSEKIGEIWFREPSSSVLVKFLFATEDLSVQVHPDDTLARRCGHERGKTEMWHILRATPSARIALGFDGTVSAEEVRHAAADGSIMGLLRWIPVHPGETWFVPAGTVHAIGAGITLCEIQQNSDVTYRLFDYGRGRGLHIEESLQALRLDSRPPAVKAVENVLVDCPYFRVGEIDVEGTEEAGNSQDLVIALEGSGTLNEIPFQAGEVWNTEFAGPLRITGSARLLTVLTGA